MEDQDRIFYNFYNIEWHTGKKWWIVETKYKWRLEVLTYGENRNEAIQNAKAGKFHPDMNKETAKEFLAVCEKIELKARRKQLTKTPVYKHKTEVRSIVETYRRDPELAHAKTIQLWKNSPFRFPKNPDWNSPSFNHSAYQEKFGELA